MPINIEFSRVFLHTMIVITDGGTDCFSIYKILKEIAFSNAHVTTVEYNSVSSLTILCTPGH